MYLRGNENYRIHFWNSLFGCFPSEDFVFYDFISGYLIIAPCEIKMGKVTRNSWQYRRPAEGTMILRFFSEFKATGDSQVTYSDL